MDCATPPPPPAQLCHEKSIIDTAPQHRCRAKRNGGCKPITHACYVEKTVMFLRTYLLPVLEDAVKFRVLPPSGGVALERHAGSGLHPRQVSPPKYFLFPLHVTDSRVFLFRLASQPDQGKCPDPAVALHTAGSTQEYMALAYAVFFQAVVCAMFGSIMKVDYKVGVQKQMAGFLFWPSPLPLAIVI
jgi:hypothetical protein